MLPDPFIKNFIATSSPQESLLQFISWILKDAGINSILSDEADHALAIRRLMMLEDLLGESWTYHEILRKGFTQGEQEEWKKGIVNGMKQGNRAGAPCIAARDVA